jgi:hypothetical protein
MSPQEARRIVDSLAHGVDPESGEVLSGDSPLCSANVIRALFLASTALSDPAPAAAAKPRAPQPGKAGGPWSTEEAADLVAAFDAGTSIRELAEQHQRSPGGIRSRLVRLGRIAESSKTP